MLFKRKKVEYSTSLILAEQWYIPHAVERKIMKHVTKGDEIAFKWGVAKTGGGGGAGYGSSVYFHSLSQVVASWTQITGEFPSCSLTVDFLEASC